MSSHDSAADRVRQWVPAPLRELSAYHVPPATGLLKLDAMENPFPMPEDLRAAHAEALKTVDINRYPDPQAAELKDLLRANLGLPAGNELVLGNGSDELILLLALLMRGPNRTVLSPCPSFVMYRMTAIYAGLKYVGVPLRTDDFCLDTEAMLDAVAEHDPALIYLANPNNPSGNLFALEDMLRIAQAANGLVIVDEAYTAFAKTSSAPVLGRYPNLLMLRTLSKTGLAGLRLGILAGPKAWLGEVEKLRLPYNINVLTQASAKFALQHWARFQHQTEEIVKQRGVLAQALALLPSTRVFPSETNFILIRTAAGRAGPIYDRLRENGILIKNLHGTDPLLEDCLRITVGRTDENARLLEALRAAL